jgi:hypothetical protein
MSLPLWIVRDVGRADRYRNRTGNSLLKGLQDELLELICLS